MKIQYELIETKKVNVIDKEVYTKTENTIVTETTVTKKPGLFNDSKEEKTKETNISRTYFIEKIYIEDEIKSHVFELIDEDTNIRKNSEVTVTCIGNELLAYKNKKEEIKYVSFLKDADKENGFFYDALNVLALIFNPLMMLIPIISLFAIFSTNSDHKKELKKSKTIKYTDFETNFVLIEAIIVLFVNIGYISLLYLIFNGLNEATTEFFILFLINLFVGIFLSIYHLIFESKQNKCNREIKEFIKKQYENI